MEEEEFGGGGGQASSDDNSGQVLDAGFQERFESSVIRGSGRRAGRRATAAGVIAIRWPPRLNDRDAAAGPGGSRGRRMPTFPDRRPSPTCLVCIVEKRDGKCGFPKGGQEPGETLLENAYREWTEETGISQTRLKIRDDCDFVDEAYLGCRYLLAECEDPPRDGGDEEQPDDPEEPGPGESTWDPGDPDGDGIAYAHWVRIDRLLGGDEIWLQRERVQLLRRAAEELQLSI